MKVISIKEPFATLLMKNIKHIETRSWNTNYRGELYIHASGKTLAKEYLTNDVVNELIINMKMNYGNIICRGKLVDCIYMDEKYVNEMKKNKIEYYCGSYEVGRYAWVFEDIEPIEPILAKGHLNIWNYDESARIIIKPRKLN